MLSDVRKLGAYGGIGTGIEPFVYHRLPRDFPKIRRQHFGSDFISMCAMSIVN